jgi:hypothetical protein
MKGGDGHGIRHAEQEVRQEEKIALMAIRRKVKGAFTELSLALHELDKYLGK